jgi:hypothetical protein
MAISTTPEEPWVIISAYAAMIRKPPLEAGREFLKLTLAFASGFVSTAIALH